MRRGPTGALPALAVVTALWLYPTAFEEVGGISLGAFALMFPVAVRRLRVERSGEFVSFLLLAGVGFGVVSILTGAANGLTDQAYTTPRYVTLLFAHHDPYVVLLSFSYQQYGTTFTSQSTFSNLPLLMFLQVPGLSYKWFALACWAGMAFLARRRFDAGVMLAQPYMVIVAASGFDDLVVLLLLTLGFLGFEGRRQKWAEWLALGCKQFANVFVVAYCVIPPGLAKDGRHARDQPRVPRPLPPLEWLGGPLPHRDRSGPPGLLEERGLRPSVRLLRMGRLGARPVLRPLHPGRPTAGVRWGHRAVAPSIPPHL